MKLFTNIFHRKRGVILFIAAFLFPLFFVVLAGIDTFSKRQKTTRNLLESNLWFSGRSALEQLEQQFSELENGGLNISFFSRLQKEERSKPINSNPYFFQLDTFFNILYPFAADDDSGDLSIFDKNWKSGYREAMESAKIAELSSQTVSNAVANYRKSLTLAQTKQQEALAIEGLARSYLKSKNYTKAIEYYMLLRNKYSQTINLAGHPYGLTAPLQLHTIGKQMGKEIFGQDSLKSTYILMLNRYWLIGPASYFFFKKEYESLLDSDVNFEESEFKKVLKCNRFLETQVIPLVMEKEKYSEFNKTVGINRTYLETEDGQYLISFKKLYFSELDNTYFAGICWNLDSVKTKVIPVMIANLEKETSLEFKLVDNKNINHFTGDSVNNPDEVLKLSFSNIPFPWSLLAIQPGYKKLESDAKRELIIYGFLLLIIIALMLFAVFALLREITRETNSMLLQTEFVHNVSHELKTPLSLIRLYGETLLLKENLPEKDQKEGLQIITKESERLSHMINNILDFSKIEMGRKEFDLKPGNLKEVVENTLDSYRYHLLKKGFKITEELESNIPKVLFDISAMEGILINLLSNAVKFSGNTKQVAIRLKMSKENIILEVADKGIGIPKKELTNIFERFYRVKGNSDFEARGSGLGLTLVKHAVDAHGWQITVKSKPQVGSTFSIFIPVNLNKEEK